MNQSLFRTFAKYVSLNILGMIGLSCYILADTFFIAQKLGADGLAALNLSIPIYSLIHGLGLMIAIGGATRFSILRSQEEEQGAQAVASTSLRMGLGIGFLCMILGLFYSAPLARTLGADFRILPLTKTYLATILLFAPFFIVNNVALAFVRNDHEPRLAMQAMLVGSFSNIILDYIFMYPLEMGMFGAALATCLAPIISLGVMVPHFRRHGEKLVMFQAKFVGSLLPDLFALGSSALIVELSSAVVLITFNLIILRMQGNTGVAAYGIVANLGLVAVSIFTGLAQGAQPLVSRLHGVKSVKLPEKVRGYALMTSLIIASLLYLGILIYSDGIVALFNREGDPQIASLAVHGLKVYFLGFFFLCVNVVQATYWSATEKPRKGFLLSMARGVVIIIPLVFVLSWIWGMTGVWLAFVLTEFVVAAWIVGESHMRGARFARNKEDIHIS